MSERTAAWRWSVGDTMLMPVADAMRQGDNEGKWTLLHGSAAKGDLRAAELLVEVKGDLDAASPGGTTLAHCAAKNGDLELMTILIEHQALVDTGDLELRSPIQIAAEADHRDMVEALLAAGADPAVRDMHGIRAVDVAVGETAVLLRRHALSQIAGDREPDPEPYERGPL